MLYSKCSMLTCNRQGCWWLCKRLSVRVWGMLIYTSCDMQSCMCIGWHAKTILSLFSTSVKHATCHVDHKNTMQGTTLWHVSYCLLTSHSAAYCLNFDSSTHSRDLHACMTDKCCQARSRRATPFKSTPAVHNGIQQNEVAQNGLRNGINITWNKVSQVVAVTYAIPHFLISFPSPQPSP